MKRTRSSFLVAMAVLLLGAGSLLADTLVEKLDQTFPMKGNEFSLDNVNGSITVGSWDRPEVRIQAEKRIKAGSRETAAEAMKAFRIEVKETGRGLDVHTAYPRRGDSVFHWIAGENVQASVSYDITVPASARITIDTVNGGITVTNVKGGSELESVNGGIDVTGGAGFLKASTVNGSVEAALDAVDGTSAIEVSTVNGRVSLDLPKALAATIDIETVNGKISSDLPVTTREFSKRRLRGEINGGGQEIEIRTVNGSVSLGAR